MLGPHEGAGAAANLLTAWVEKRRFRHINPPPPTDPPAFGANTARAQRPREKQVEPGRQQKAVTDQAVGGIEGRIVQHFEIDGAMHRPGCVIDAFIDIEFDDGMARRWNNKAR